MCIFCNLKVGSNKTLKIFQQHYFGHRFVSIHTQNNGIRHNDTMVSHHKIPCFAHRIAIILCFALRRSRRDDDDHLPPPRTVANLSRAVSVGLLARVRPSSTGGCVRLVLSDTAHVVLAVTTASAPLPPPPR